MKKHFSTQSKATFISYLFNKTDLNIINNFLINGTLESTKSIKLLASETAQDIFLIANTNKLLDTSIYNSTPIYSTENLFYFLRNDNEIMEGKFEQLIHFFKEKIGFHSFIEIDNKLNNFSFTENTVNITIPLKIVYENKSLREFVLQTFKIVNDKFGDNFLIQNISNRETQINKQTFNTITIPKYFNMTRFFGVFDTEPNFEVLKTEKGAVRFYNENLRILNKEFIYLTNQWENKDSNSTNPKFSDFSKFIRDYSSNKYVAIFENDIFKLLETKTFFTNAQSPQ